MTIITKTLAVPYAFDIEMPSLAKIYKCKGKGRPASNIDVGTSSDEPTTYITAAASEIALVMASIIPVMIPGIARGRTTEAMHCHFVAPKP